MAFQPTHRNVVELTSEWRADEDGQHFQAHHPQIHAAPSEVRLSILLPQPTEGTGSVIRTVQLVLATEPINIRWSKESNVWMLAGSDAERRGKRIRDEEAIEEERPLEEEVDQCIEEVPDEENAYLFGRAFGEKT